MVEAILWVALAVIVAKVGKFVAKGLFPDDWK
jgi:hypothetical protein